MGWGRVNLGGIGRPRASRVAPGADSGAEEENIEPLSGGGPFPSTARPLPAPGTPPHCRGRGLSPFQAPQPVQRDPVQPKERIWRGITGIFIRDWDGGRAPSCVLQESPALLQLRRPGSSVSGPRQQCPEPSQKRSAQRGREKVGKQTKCRQSHQQPEHARARVQRGQPVGGAQRW